MRLAVDMGGTFTDLVVEEHDGTLTMHKAATTPADPLSGISAVLELAAAERGTGLGKLLAATDVLVHGTTRSINAIVTGTTARTALLVTAGHPDVLVLREGGRTRPFDRSIPFPEPYVPRHLTFEVPERIGAAGEVVAPLDEAAVVDVLARVASAEVEAVAVCLLWSVVNGAHETRVGELLSEHLPGVPFTLSHRLHPVLREYRRASATAIDASLKPLMAAYLEGLAAMLGSAGFRGRLLMLTSSGGVVPAEEVAAAPIHSLGSGPSVAPVAGRHFAGLDTAGATAIVADTGGTTFDVSLVRQGRIPVSEDTWIGPRFYGHLVGFPTIDVHSVGAGGGSIASVDAHGMLHVGPASAGAYPGPASYGRGGRDATLTDACLVLGFLDPEGFLGGRMRLDDAAAYEAVRMHVAEPLGWSVDRSAAAILDLATEHMVRAIHAITVDHGVDPADAVVVGGGGAAGLNIVDVARRLGAARVLLPGVGAALSAAGALLSDLVAEYTVTFPVRTDRFDREGVVQVLERLAESAADFVAAGGERGTVELVVSARYARQVWELDMVLGELGSMPVDPERLAAAFHRRHEEVFGYADPGAHVEVLAWRARARVPREGAVATVARPPAGLGGVRRVRGLDGCERALDAHALGDLAPGVSYAGPAIVESPLTTIVIDGPERFEVTASGSLLVTAGPSAPRCRMAAAEALVR